MEILNQYIFYKSNIYDFISKAGTDNVVFPERLIVHLMFGILILYL
jgi:hypothetical protein